MENLSHKISIIIDVVNKSRGKILESVKEVERLSRVSASASSTVKATDSALVGLNRSASAVKGKVSSIAGEMGVLDVKAKSLKTSLADAATSLAKLATVASAAIFSVKSAIDFESSMADVKKVVDATDAEINTLRSDIIKMSREIPLTANELAQIAAAAGQLGVAQKDIGGFVEVVSKMSTAFNMSAEDAGNAIGKIRNIFGLAGNELEGFGDLVNQLGNNTAAKEGEIVNTMMRIGAASKQFGLAKEQAAALAAAMISLGQAPEVAATSINTLLVKMQTAGSQGPKFQEALASIGMSSKQMANDIQEGPQTAISNLLAALAKLDGQKRSEALVGLFGTEYQDNIGVLVAGLDSYINALGKVADKSAYAGSMQKEFQARTEATVEQLKLLRNSVNEIAINLGTAFLPAIKAVVTGLMAITTAMATFSSEHPHIAAAIGVITAALVALAGTQAGIVVLRGALKLLGIEIASTATAATILSKANLAQVFTSPMAAINGLLGKLNLLGKAFALVGAATAGWEFGSWLNQFGPIQKMMTGLIYTFDRVQLAAQKMWAVLSGGDVGAVEQKIEIAKQAYDERLKEIDEEVAEREKPKEKAASLEVSQPEQGQVQQPEKPKTDDGSIDGFSKHELEAMDTWDEDKLTPERKAALEKFRAGKNQEAKEAPVAETKEGDVAKVKVEDKLVESPIKQESDVVATEEGPSLFAKERSGELAAEKEAEAEERRREEEKRETERQEKIKAEKEKEAAEREAFLSEDSGSGSRVNEQFQEDAKTYADAMAHAHEVNAEAGKEAANEWGKAQEEATEKAKTAFQKYFEKVRSLQDEIAGRETSLADKLDAMKSAGLTEEQQYRKQQKDAKGYEKAAKAAFALGDYDKAKQLSDKAGSLYEGLQGGAGKIDEKAGNRAAYTGVKSAGELGIAIAKAQQVDVGKAAMAATSGNTGPALDQARAAMGQIANQGEQKVDKVHELRFDGGAVRGGGPDVEALLDLIEKAGMAAG